VTGMRRTFRGDFYGIPHCKMNQSLDHSHALLGVKSHHVLFQLTRGCEGRQVGSVNPPSKTSTPKHSHPSGPTDTPSVGNGSSAGHLDEGVPLKSPCKHKPDQPAYGLQVGSPGFRAGGVAALANRRSGSPHPAGGRSMPQQLQQACRPAGTSAAASAHRQGSLCAPLHPLVGS